MIIALEGVDGCGKSTCAKLLADKLNELGHKTMCLREPGGSALGEKLRELLLDPKLAMSKDVQPLLFTASRIQLLRECLDLGLFDQGYILVFDRFWHSTVAYQCYGNGIPVETVRFLNHMVQEVLINNYYPYDGRREVHAYHLKVSPETSAARWAATGKAADRFEGEKAAFKQRVADGYKDLEKSMMAAQYGISPLIPINAECSAEDVVKDIITRLQLNKVAKEA